MLKYGRVGHVDCRQWALDSGAPSGALFVSMALAGVAALRWLAARPRRAHARQGRRADRRGRDASSLVDFPAGFRRERVDRRPRTPTTSRRRRGSAGARRTSRCRRLTAALPQARSRRVQGRLAHGQQRGRRVPAPTAPPSDALAPLRQVEHRRLPGEAVREAASARIPTPQGSVDDVLVTLERQDIAGLGDDSVVYEGSDGAHGHRRLDDDRSASAIAAVQVGRTVDAVTYLTTGEDLTEILTPAIDASIGAAAHRAGRGHGVTRATARAGGRAARARWRPRLARPARRPSPISSSRVAGVLRLADFPSGWKESRRGSTDDATIDAQAPRSRVASGSPRSRRRTGRTRRAKSAELRRGELERHQHGERVPVDREGRRRDGDVPPIRGCRSASSSCSPRCSRPSCAKNKSLAKQLASVKTDIGLVDGVQHRRRGDRLPGHGRRRARRTVRRRRSGSGSITVRVGATLAGYSYTSDADISAALQPAIVASVTPPAADDAAGVT